MPPAPLSAILLCLLATDLQLSHVLFCREGHVGGPGGFGAHLLHGTGVTAGPAAISGLQGGKPSEPLTEKDRDNNGPFPPLVVNLLVHGFLRRAVGLLLPRMINLDEARILTESRLTAVCQNSECASLPGLRIV